MNPDQLFFHSLKITVGKQSPQRQRHHIDHFPPVRNSKTALRINQGIHSQRHILIGNTDHADIVAVMPDTGCNRPGFQAESSDETKPDIAVSAVTFQNCNLSNILFRSAFLFIPVKRQVQFQMLRRQGQLQNTDHGSLRFLRENLEGICRDLFQPDGIQECRRIRRKPARSEQSLIHNLPVFQDSCNPAFLQVRKQDDIRLVSGCDQTAVTQSEMLRGRTAGDPVHRQRIRARLNRMCDHIIQMPRFRNIQRIAVIGAETEKRSIPYRNQRQKRVQIPCHRAFTDQNLHPLAQFLLRLVQRTAFVTVADSGCKVSIERFSGQHRAVSVNSAVESLHLFKHLRHFEQNTGNVHQFGKTGGKRFGSIFADICRGKCGAGGLQRRGRDTGADLYPKVHAHTAGGLQKKVNRFRSRNIRQLVRIADRRRHAARQNAPFELERRNHRGLHMNMRINKPRNGGQPASVNLALTVIRFPDTDDPVVADSDISPHRLPCDQIEDSDIFYYERRRDIPLRFINDLFQHSKSRLHRDSSPKKV